MHDPVLDLPQPGRRNANDVADMMGKALPARAAALGRCKHRPAEQDKAVGILVVRAVCLGNQFVRVTANPLHMTRFTQNKSILTLDFDRDDGLPHVVHAEACVE